MNAQNMAAVMTLVRLGLQALATLLVTRGWLEKADVGSFVSASVEVAAGVITMAVTYLWSRHAWRKAHDTGAQAVTVRQAMDNQVARNNNKENGK